MSKGSKRRPGEGYEDVWERIFGKKKPERFARTYDGPFGEFYKPGIDGPKEEEPKDDKNKRD